MAFDAMLNNLVDKRARITACQILETYAYRGEKEKAFNWVHRAHRKRNSGMLGVARNAYLKHINVDPLCAAMLRKLKLPGLR
jgi:3-methyladenine DNA glycosylase Mpg